MTVPGFRTALGVASRRQARGSTPRNFAGSISERKSAATGCPLRPAPVVILSPDGDAKQGLRNTYENGFGARG